jgi:hypothetical protein
MATHDLKTDPQAFDAALRGVKTFEIRFNDRGFAVGDTLRLHETVHTGEEMKAGAPLKFTGRVLVKTVSHIQTGYGLGKGWCCLSYAQSGQHAQMADLLKIKRAVMGDILLTQFNRVKMANVHPDRHDLTPAAAADVIEVAINRAVDMTAREVAEPVWPYALDVETPAPFGWREALAALPNYGPERLEKSAAMMRGGAYVLAADVVEALAALPAALAE